MTSIYQKALEYHSAGRKGKIEVVPSKPVSTQQDLSLAYTPGVAGACLMIAEKEESVYEYTAKSNLVAVVSNGTAVLGLGDIGPAASKPVMEGKGILFKKFADIDVFDIELNAKNPEDVIRACEMLEPTFGGINLEDIKAPECFYIEEQLKKRLRIPVFHDDQHGTAVISGAAFLNALEVVGKKIEAVKVVFCGGGAAAIACAHLYLSLGVRPENLWMVDSKGVIYEGRSEGMNPYKQFFARTTQARTLAEVLVGADAFIGVSTKDCVTPDMVRHMASQPILFAMANPDPEILPEAVLAVRPDAIIATGRSDYPNQVNNVLGFPFIFRGALDTLSTTINEEMKMAAVKALAALAKQEVPESVSRAYGGQTFKFGKDYLIPKPFDQRVLLWVAPAVAEAAMRTGVAKKPLFLPQYREQLEHLLGSTYTVMTGVKRKVREGVSSQGRKVVLVFPEGEHPKILRAAATLLEEGSVEPVLLGVPAAVQEAIRSLDLFEGLSGVRIVDPASDPLADVYARRFFEKRLRKGATLLAAQDLMKQGNYFGAMMVEAGHADGLVNGVSQSYPETLRPAIQCIGVKPGLCLAGIYLMISKHRLLWFADTTVNIEPTAQELAAIAIQTAEYAKGFMVQEPRVALLSFSNFGSNDHPHALRVKQAVELIKQRCPGLKVDGEMQADTALNPVLSQQSFSFNEVPGDANILIFPDLQSGNIAYKLLAHLGEVETIGPLLVGMNCPVFVLQQNCDVPDIVHMSALAAMQVQLGSQGFEKNKI